MPASPQIALRGVTGTAGLFVVQSDHRIDPHRAARGEVAAAPFETARGSPTLAFR